MSTQINDGGPAFPASLGIEAGYGNTIPRQLPDGQNAWETVMPGMSLRDWFAGQALAGILSDPTTGIGKESAARHAYNYADAMLKVREAQQ